MALTHHIANLDTKEYFDPGIFGGNTKASGLLGDFLSGNALARLLIRDWLENRIAAVSDNGQIEGYEMFLDYDKLKSEFTDISSTVFSMMCELQTEIVLQEIQLDFDETYTDPFLFKNALNYYKSSVASQNFKQKFDEQFSQKINMMIKEVRESGYEGLNFSGS